MTEFSVHRKPRKGYKDGNYRNYCQWTEFQVKAGRNVISRHDTREAAEQAWKQLTRKDDDAPAQ